MIDFSRLTHVEFMVMWTALQQFIDNSDDETGDVKIAAECAVAQKICDEFTLYFATCASPEDST